MRSLDTAKVFSYPIRTLSTPERIACVDVPALPLQLLLDREPSWRGLPVVVVRDDRPQGVVLWTNLHARRLRILPGMTFAAARSLAHDLRAAVVEPAEIDACVAKLHEQLCQFSPRVEPSSDEPGVFFVDPGGLTPLYGSLEQWSSMVQAQLRRVGFDASVVVGFHRYRSYALARARPMSPRPTRSARRGLAWVIPDLHTETRLAASVPLSALAVRPDLRDQLHVLGVKTLGQLLQLPRAELSIRFGEEAANLHAAASDRWSVLQPRELVEPIAAELQLEPPDADHTRLLFGLRGKLHELMGQLADRGQAMSALQLRLELDHADDHVEFIEPASPTLDTVTVIDLVRLRLESLMLPAAVEAVLVQLEGTRANRQQLHLFRTHQRRDLAAAGRALARIRASFGDESVTQARLRPAHLPEASYAWEPMQELRFPRVRSKADAGSDRSTPTAGALCRRVLARPVPLPPRPRHEPEAWLGRRGNIVQMQGPYRVSGGWWVRTVERDYYFAETNRGEVLWIYYDRPRRRWFLHGLVD